MQGHNTALFFERRGRKIIEFGGNYWFSTEKRMYMPIPFHLDLSFERGEIASFLARKNLSGVRYGSTSQPGLDGGLYVIREKNYTSAMLESRQRRDVKKGLESVEIRPVTADVLLAQGLQMNVETMERQGRFEAEYADPQQWARLVRAIDETEGASVLGAFVGDRLAAYGVHMVEDGWCHLLHQFSSAELLPTRANHALCFEGIAQMMRRDDVHTYCGGLSSLIQLEGLHRFKLRQGYTFEPRQTVVQLHPLLDHTLLSRFGQTQVARWRASKPEDQRVQRIGSIVEAAGLSKGNAPIPPTPVAPAVEESQEQEVLAR